MELYLDSADINEIKEAFKIGIITGLTTTPTFMHRHGITDIDAAILELSNIVPILQIEALGNNAEEIYKEAIRQTELGLDKKKTVFKIPISLEGIKACRKLVDQGFMVNIHLVYTLQQAYMAMQAGATYICPLVGRLQDQGHDALGLVEQCVEMTSYYNSDSKIMFSSVRYVEHVKNAINIGVHTCTIPWKVMKKLTENHFTSIGTQEFEDHTRLMTQKVSDIMRSTNPIVEFDTKVQDALVIMTSAGYGALSVVDSQGQLTGIFTDGDLRRSLEKKGQETLNQSVGSLSAQNPSVIDLNSPLIEAAKIFQEKHIDTIIVTEQGKVVGMIDIQDMK